jgi:hypothetical protein
MSVENLSDESITRYYDSIRQQVEADQKHKSHFADGPAVRERAEQLRQEMTKRKLWHSPIRWPS